MPRIKIKQLDTRVATSGMHFGGPPERRKLFPGEVVDLPEGELLEALFATGKIELTLDPVTRPLDYKNVREAKLTAPTFKSRGPDEDHEIAKAFADVAERLKAGEEQPVEVESSPAEEQKKPRNRRAARRAAAQGAASGQEATA